jgi:Kdo2-lipid IVA lauroyltransferase/acyltransferase
MLEKIFNIVSSYFLLSFGFVYHILPRSLKKVMSAGLGKLMILLSKSRKEVTLDNLRHAFPEKDSAWIEKTCENAYLNLGITFCELFSLYLLSEDQLRSRFKYDNVELINEVYDRGNGVIFLSGHYSNWEYIAYTAGLYTGIPVNIIVKPQRNKVLDDKINQARIRSGNTVINMYKAAREIIVHLRSGHAVALLADQSATVNKDVFVDFFGRPAATYEAPAGLALRFKVPIIMGFSQRNSDGTYQAKLSEITHDDLKYDKEGIKELTRRHVKMLEDEIRQQPDLWVWQHKRWKHTPPVEVDENV